VSYVLRRLQKYKVFFSCNPFATKIDFYSQNLRLLNLAKAIQKSIFQLFIEYKISSVSLLQYHLQFES